MALIFLLFKNEIVLGLVSCTWYNNIQELITFSVMYFNNHSCDWKWVNGKNCHLYHMLVFFKRGTFLVSFFLCLILNQKIKILQLKYKQLLTKTNGLSEMCRWNTFQNILRRGATPYLSVLCCSLGAAVFWQKWFHLEEALLSQHSKK